MRRSPVRPSCFAFSPASPAKVTSRSRLKKLSRPWPRGRLTTRTSSPRQTPCWPHFRPPLRQPRPSGGWSLRPLTSEWKIEIQGHSQLQSKSICLLLLKSKFWRVSKVFSVFFSESLLNWEPRSLHQNHISAQTRYRKQPLLQLIHILHIYLV